MRCANSSNSRGWMIILNISKLSSSFCIRSILHFIVLLILFVRYVSIYDLRTSIFFNLGGFLHWLFQVLF
jgi:hypothetical protein